MATVTVSVFHQFRSDLGNKIHDLDTDVYKMALVTDVLAPVVGAALPHFGGTGTTNYATNEVTPGGNYTAGGVTLGSVDYVMSGATVPWRAAKVLIAATGANPTNARYAIIYNSTVASKRCIAFIDLLSVRNLAVDPLEIRFDSVDGVGAIIDIA